MTTKTDHPNVDTISHMTAAVFDQDHDALAGILTDDFVFHLRGPVRWQGDHAGLGGFLEALGGIFEMTAGRITLEQQLCVGADGWAAEFEHATLGRPGDDATMESRNAFVYRFDGDRIAEMWMYLGALPEVADAFFG